MSQEKFDRFYSQKPFHDLLRQLIAHRLNGNLMEPEWYDGLVAHLRRRNLSPDEQQQLQEALQANHSQLTQRATILQEELSTDKRTPVQKAGAAMIDASKNIWRSFLFSIGFAVIVVILSILATDAGFTDRQHLVGFISLFSIFFIIIQSVLFYNFYRRLRDAGELFRDNEKL